VALKTASPILRLDKNATANQPGLHLGKLPICQGLSKLLGGRKPSSGCKERVIHSLYAKEQQFHFCSRRYQILRDCATRPCEI
jgi:hypothetical protein